MSTSLSPSVFVTALALIACSPAPRPAPPPPPTPEAVPPPAPVDAAVVAAEPDAAAVVDAPAPAPVYAGLRTIAFRAGARPPRGTAGAHGREVWSVILAAASGATPELQTLFQQATTTHHLAASTGEVRCSPSAGEPFPAAIPQGEGAMIVEVSFRSEREARAFAAALAEAPLWVGRIRVLCAD